jgi:flagellar biosynthesis chaperone FliJ
MIKILLDRRRDVRMMQRLCFALGARSTGPAFEQMVDQLFEARRRSAEIVEQFSAEMEALRAELAEERAKRAQLQVLGEWHPERTRVQ